MWNVAPFNSICLWGGEFGYAFQSFFYSLLTIYFLCQKLLIPTFFQPEFVRQLTTVLGTVGNEPFVRQAAGLQLKNTLVSKDLTQVESLRTRFLSLFCQAKIFRKTKIQQNSV
jgi:hypothetical protein